MKKSHLFALWGGLFVLCAALGFISNPGTALKILLTLLSVAFFIPGALLLRHTAAAAFGKFSAAVGRTENAASGIDGAVPIGAGKTRVNGKLIHFAAEFALIIGVQ